MKRDFIYILIITLLLIIGTCAINKCSSYKNEYNRSLICLNDTIHTYKDRCNRLVATTLAYEANLKDLKLLNNDLYNEISALKSKPVTATHITTTITNEIHDTCYIIKPSDIVQGITEHFDYSNPYRTLAGQISYHPDTLELKIDSDKVYVDLTVAMDKKNQIHVVSNNPYIQYNEITGFTVPKTKQKRWGIGPFVGASVDVTSGKFSPAVGVGISYGLIRF